MALVFCNFKTRKPFSKNLRGINLDILSWLEMLNLVYKILVLLILKIATTKGYNLERERKCDHCEGNILTDTAKRLDDSYVPVS